MISRSKWVAERLGTRNWCVSQRLTDNLRAKGYEVAVSQKRLDTILAEHERATGQEAQAISADYERRYGIPLASMLVHATGRKCAASSHTTSSNAAGACGASK